MSEQIAFTHGETSTAAHLHLRSSHMASHQDPDIQPSGLAFSQWWKLSMSRM